MINIEKKSRIWYLYMIHAYIQRERERRGVSIRKANEITVNMYVSVFDVSTKGNTNK